MMRSLFLRCLLPGAMVALAAFPVSAEEQGHPLDPSVAGIVVELPSPSRRHLGLFGGPLRERDAPSPSYEAAAAPPAPDAAPAPEDHAMHGMASEPGTFDHEGSMSDHKTDAMPDHGMTGGGHGG